MDHQRGLRLCAFLAVLVVASGSAGFKPNSSIPVNTWTNANDKWFVFPEQNPQSNYYLPVLGQRPNFGIAVSGGGYRAVTLALGYVRGLYMMNLTQQARYLASNSGGSWFNTAFSYQKTLPVDTFIGPYVPPQNLTKDALKAAGKGEQGAFVATISNAVIKANAAAGAAVDVITRDDKGPAAWTISVGNAFLAPYELNADQSTFSANGTKGPIHPALQKMDLKTYYYQGAVDGNTQGNISRPFPIILGSVFNRVSNESLFYPCEFTPEYVGVPSVWPSEEPNKTVGGGMVDPQGFNSFPPVPPPKVPAALQPLGKVPANYGVLPKSTKGLRHLLQAAAAAAPPAAGSTIAAPAPKTTAASGAAPAPAAAAPAGAASSAVSANNNLLPLKTEVNSSFIMPLKVATGISSSFLSQGLVPADSEALKELTGTEELQYWNQVNFKGIKQSFADGGGTDNLAVTPLLRRKVRYIVACIAASEYLGSDTNIEDYAVAQWDIAALFGALPLKHKNIKKDRINHMRPQTFNKVTQVFPSSAWAPLINGFKKTIAAGGPAYHLAEYTVMDNPYQAVHGGWKVKVLWVINAVEKNWEKALPEDIRNSLNAARKRKGGLYATEEGKKDATPEDDAKGWGPAELKSYPYISTFNADYSPELTGMLNQQATWQMLELQPQLTQLLTGSGVKVGAPSNTGQKTEDKNVGVPSKNLKSGAVGVHCAAWLQLLAAGLALVLSQLLLMP